MAEKSRVLLPRIPALALMVGILLAFCGCASEEAPPATVREYQEPTQTVDPLADASQGGYESSTSPLPEGLRRELEEQVQLINVAYAADGGYLIVNFLAPPRLAILWQPGELYVVDQTTGAKYDNIPFMPKIGRLIGRPVQEGQPGYVMLQNQPPLKPNSKVTVVLGAFRKADVTVEQTGMPIPQAP
ncbi:MAG: hypothetical protein OEV43_04960 [Coriobacteriia bacterium]|nr:hypothetical protein [Coriobacteriia bacterium]